METLKHLSGSHCCFTPSACTREAIGPAGVGLRAQDPALCTELIGMFIACIGS